MILERSQHVTSESRSMERWRTAVEIARNLPRHDRDVALLDYEKSQITFLCHSYE